MSFVPSKTLNLAVADELASLTIRAAELNGFAPISVCVLDPSGAEIVTKRMDKCPPMAYPKIAHAKASTCVAMGKSSRAWGEKYLQDRKGNPSDSAMFTRGLNQIISLAGDLAVFPGGVLIRDPVDNEIVGSIGVSGAAGDEDEFCALIAVQQCSANKSIVSEPRAHCCKTAKVLRLDKSSKTTCTGEPILDGLPIVVPKILLPRKDINLSKWACVACDQFETQPKYWAAMSEFVGTAPSSLQIVFPEVYLASVTGGPPDQDKKRIEDIRQKMKSYIDQQVFVERPPAFTAIDRRTACVPSRKGLVVAVDLEEYNFNCPTPTLIRPTEKTIVARLPARIEIRENAPLELPHIIMIIDDPGKTVIEPLFADQSLAVPEYEVELFKGAGQVKGLRVTPQGTAHVEKSMKALAAREIAAAKAANRPPALILIGDGNHSLATAKLCWEKLKVKEGIGMDHPQRYALVELQNLHDDGVVFEPIHRILLGANPDTLLSAFESAWGCKAEPYIEPLAKPVPHHGVVLVRGPNPSDRVMLTPPAGKLAVVSMSSAVDAFIEKNSTVKIGFVHEVDAVVKACLGGNAAGLILPSLDKSRFLSTIHDIGTLPRKAFSMGEANEKRFYVEARNILPALPQRSKTTATGEPILDGLPIVVPKILLPRKDINLCKWACVACDQFETQPNYWAAMSEFVGDSPSSLHIVFPEVYLASVTGEPPEQDKKRIEDIRKRMTSYIDRKVFVERPPAFTAIDRKTACVPSRKGLVMAVDLEEYNFNSPTPTLIRPTEKTIVARLPARIEIRENAPLELPHIIMIIDDPGKTVIEPLFASKSLAVPEYEVELFKGAGLVKGLRVTPEGTAHVEKSMKALAAREIAAAKAANRQPALILIGDGNHSLATAKLCWEKLKAKEGIGMDHPQRYALVEVQNLHDDGVVFEPIHRILRGANPNTLLSALESAWGCKAEPYIESLEKPVPHHGVVLVRGPNPSDRVLLTPPAGKLAVVSMSSAVDAFIEKNSGVKIAFVHEADAVIEACIDGNAAGLILPSLDKSRFLSTIHDIGTLPRKAFSMGEANEKRFYVEARNILPSGGDQHRGQLLAAFNSLDPNRSGRIPLACFRELFATLMPKVSDEAFDDMMNSSETCSGGSVDYVNFVGFLLR